MFLTYIHRSSAARRGLQAVPSEKPQLIRFRFQIGSSMQGDREPSSSMPLQDEKSIGTQLPWPTLVAPGQTGSTNPSERPPMLNPETEKALLQQVMTLTPEEINSLPPEQSYKVLQLQQLLRP